jgi:hypothetical protein
MKRKPDQNGGWIPDGEAISLVAAAMEARSAWSLAACLPVTKVTDFYPRRPHNNEQRRRDADDRRTREKCP